jgi:hypothetical protein
VTVHRLRNERRLALAELADREQCPREQQQIIVHGLFPLCVVALGGVLRGSDLARLLAHDVDRSVEQARLVTALLASREPVAEHCEDEHAPARAQWLGRSSSD